MKKLLLLLALMPALLLEACNGCGEKEPATDTTQQPPAPALNVPAFNADTAYDYVARQVAFGPRVPGTPAQKQCAAWIEQELKKNCDTVYRQEVEVKAGNGQTLPCINLVGSIHPQAKRRILLLAHWDSRPWADEDTVNRNEPIAAADDGGSGVAVMLEVARQLNGKPLPADLGVDLLFTDVEDYGKSEWGEHTYCLGTQYWARNPHVPGYRAEFGILLDMVGARNARFLMEPGSRQMAGEVQQHIYEAAGRAGYSSFFPFTVSNMGIEDDHVYVNELAKIPTVDIINHANGPAGDEFPAHWHTHGDNMSIIDKATLKAVGQTMLQVLYEAGAQGNI